MNILILSLTYPPEPAEHIHDLGKYLTNRSHKVTVLTSLPSYPFGKVYSDYRNKIWCKEILDGVKIVRLPVFPSHSKSILFRFLYYISNALSMTIFILFIKKNFDAILIYHPPVSIALPGLVYKLFKNVPLIYWIQDIWPEVIEAHTRKNILTNTINNTAKFIYEKADKIIVISNGFKQNLIDKGLNGEKIHIIHNWSDPKCYFPISPSKIDYKYYKLCPNNFHLFYAGNIGFMQNLENLVEAATHLWDINNIKIVFMGTGVKIADLENLTKYLNLMDKVIFLGRVPKSEVNLCYGFADAFIVHIKDIPYNSITIPHKIYGYMLSSKPVIAAIRGDAKDEILNAGAGISCDPQDAISIARAIKQLYRMPVVDRKEMGLSGRNFVMHERSIEVLGDEFEKIILNIRTK